jgi:sugar lactone lactonase YvrE
LFVSDQQNNRVLEYKRPFSNGMNASVVLGQPAFTAGFPATTQNGLNFPWNLALDSAGKLYVADGGGNRVLVFLPPFTSHQLAKIVIGQPDFVSSDPATTQNGLSFPAGVAVDKAGDLFVAERSNNRILEFVPPFSSGMNASMVIGQPSFVSSVAATSQSGLWLPAGIALDRAGHLFVADQSNNRVLEFEPPFLAGMKASVVIGQLNFISRTAAVTASGLSGPLGVALDAGGNLFVADARNNRVLEFKPPFVNGKAAAVVIGQSAFTTNTGATTATGLVFPAGIGLDGSGNLYVSDSNNSRLLQFEPPFTTGMGATVVVGEPDFTTAVSNTTQSGLSGPVGLVVKQP